MGESPQPTSTASGPVVADDTLVQAIAESMPGWNGPEPYDENREWLSKHQRMAQLTDEEFEADLAHLNGGLHRVNAAALAAARGYVAAIAPALLERDRVVAERAWQEGHAALFKALRSTGREVNMGYDTGITINPYRASVKSEAA